MKLLEQHIRAKGEILHLMLFDKSVTIWMLYKYKAKSVPMTSESNLNLDTKVNSGSLSSQG